MNFYPLIRPLAFALDAETAHRMTIRALKLVPPRRPPDFPPSLKTRVAGIDFPTPIGLAAGFDKDAEVPEQMLSLGFGFVEVGTLTPRSQEGNPRPRLFRLKEDRAVINRMLTLQPEIAQAMVYGDRRPHLVALLVPDPEVSKSADLQAKLQRAVDRVNSDLSVIEKVRRFILADEGFTIENEQLTPSMKIRRHVISKVYGDRLDALYKR